jgi:adenylate kinase family enzyme
VTDSKPRLIVIYGPPASGKTSLAHEISAHLRIPVLSRDLLKEGIADSSSVNTDDQRFAVGQQAYRLFYRLLAEVINANSSVVVESAFVYADAHESLQPILQQANALAIRCWANPTTVIHRYRQRMEAGKSHRSHPDEYLLGEMDRPDFDWSKYELSDLFLQRVDVMENDLSTEEILARINMFTKVQ